MAGGEDGMELEAGRAEAWRAMFLVADTLRERTFSLFQDRDLSPQQGHLLLRLEPGSPVPMRQVAQLLACDASNVTGLSDRLERRGLLERQASAADRRVKMLLLTSAGEVLRAELLAAFERVPPIFEGFSVGELETLRDFMLRVASVAAPGSPPLGRARKPADRLAGATPRS